MRRLFIIACSAICLCVMHSCSSMYYVKKNEEYTKKMAQNIVKKEGNAFFLGQGISTGSYLWYYTDSTVVINRLVKGKITWTQEYPSTNREFNLKAFTADTIKALDADVSRRNHTVLDGDMIVFKIISQGNELEGCYLILVDKFINQNYDHPMNNELVRILKTIYR